MAKRKLARKSYSKLQRQQILSKAAKASLTANQVEKRFGVKAVTYYSWRKSLKTRRPSSLKTNRAQVAANGLTAQVRSEVQRRVQELVPRLVRDEVDRCVKEILKT